MSAHEQMTRNLIANISAQVIAVGHPPRRTVAEACGRIEGDMLDWTTAIRSAVLSGMSAVHAHGGHIAAGYLSAMVEASPALLDYYPSMADVEARINRVDGRTLYRAFVAN